MNKSLSVGARHVKIEFPDTSDFIEDNLREICENENISVVEVCYFVALFYLGSRLLHSLLVFSWVLKFCFKE